MFTPLGVVAIEQVKQKSVEDSDDEIVTMHLLEASNLEMGFNMGLEHPI